MPSSRQTGVYSTTTVSGEHNCPPQVQEQVRKSLGTTFLTFHNQIRERPVHRNRTLCQTNRCMTWVNIILREATESNAIKSKTVAGSSSSSPPLTGWTIQASWSLLKPDPSPPWASHLPAMWETWLDPWWEDPLEEGMATHSRILAWRIPWTEKPGGLQSLRSQKSQT